MSDWGKAPQSTVLTDGHRRLHNLLVGMGLQVEDERSCGRYVIDCYVPEVHLGFEFDGSNYHSSVLQRRRDEERDRAILAEAGLPLLRVTEREMRRAGGREAVMERVRAFIEEHGDDVEERREWERNRPLR